MKLQVQASCGATTQADSGRSDGIVDNQGKDHG